MARNAGKRGGSKQLDQEKHPEIVYNRLELSKRLACFNFWLHLNTEGEEGWSPTEKPGSIWKYRSSKYIRQNIKESSWAKIGKAMATLAQDLQKRGIKLVDPLQQHRDRCSSILGNKTSPEDSDAESSSDTSSYQEQEEEEEDMPKKPVRISEPLSPLSPDISSNLKRLSISGPV